MAFITRGDCRWHNYYLEGLDWLIRNVGIDGLYIDDLSDYWLVEISGIPFGVMGEVLQDEGNPCRGMVYGMTGRLPYMADPRPIWRVWDDFGMEGSQMIGYWSSDCPVRTDSASVLATVYRQPQKALVAVAGWITRANRKHRWGERANWRNLLRHPGSPEPLTVLPEFFTGGTSSSSTRAGWVRRNAEVLWPPSSPPCPRQSSSSLAYREWKAAWKRRNHFRGV